MFTIKYHTKDQSDNFTQFIIPVGDDGAEGDQIEARKIWNALLQKRSVNHEDVIPEKTALCYGGRVVGDDHVTPSRTVVEFRIIERMPAQGIAPIVIDDPEPLTPPAAPKPPEEVTVPEEM